MKIKDFFKKFVICIVPLGVITILNLTKNLYGRFIQGRFLPCWFNLVTGYQCSGCGGTRSFFALMNGDILSSFRYNAFVPCMMILSIVIYIRIFLKVILNKNIEVLPKNDNWIFILLIIFLSYFIIRNFV